MKVAKNALLAHWIIVVASLLSVITYLMICHLFPEQVRLDFDQSKLGSLRGIFYALAIIGFPVTSLLRFISLRLNQTMPGNEPAEKRYFKTILATQIMMEMVAFCGFIMFLFGDDFNTLYIFSLMAVLGIFIHRPKHDELAAIMQALQVNSER